MTKSLVFGATGLVGQSLISELSNSDVEVLAVSRRPILNIPINIKVLEVDLEVFIQKHKFPECDHVFICLGTTIKKAGSQKEFKKVDFNYCVEIAKKAKDSGVKRISLVSSIGATPTANNFYLKTKGETEEAIKEIEFNSTNIYRPSLLIGQRKDPRLMEGLGQQFAGLVDPFLWGSMKKFRSIAACKLARAMKQNINSADGVNYFYFEDFLDL
jgi:uncharacterized protein YbjT (DUF2867 family)